MSNRERLQWLDVEVTPGSHVLKVKLATGKDAPGRFIAEEFGKRLSPAGVAKRLRALANKLDPTAAEELHKSE